MKLDWKSEHISKWHLDKHNCIKLKDAITDKTLSEKKSTYALLEYYIYAYIIVIERLLNIRWRITMWGGIFVV